VMSGKGTAGRLFVPEMPWIYEKNDGGKGGRKKVGEEKEDPEEGVRKWSTHA